MTYALQSSQNKENLARAHTLQKGERPIENAPQVVLPNGYACIPQHYLSYEHTRDTIEAILADIDYDPNYLIFVNEDLSVPFIQIGVIGYDNYKSKKDQAGQKIVFGRRWRVEPNLPTSEIIQTVFLALKKAREHEIRECFKVKWDNSVTTPFNSHQDLPLLANHKALIKERISKNISLSDCLSRVRYKNETFEIIGRQKCQNGKWLIDLQHPCLAQPLSLLMPNLRTDTVLYTLMDELICESDQHVDEYFTYKGFARFSRHNSIQALSDISVRTRSRQKTHQTGRFDKNLAQEQYETDASRVPELTNSHYSETLRKRLKQMNVKLGFIPE